MFKVILGNISTFGRRPTDQIKKKIVEFTSMQNELNGQDF